MPKKSVLIIDDRESYREELSDLLRDAGYDVIGAPSVDDAIRLLNSGGRPAFILADRQLEDGTAIETVQLERLREAAGDPAAGGSLIVVFTTIDDLTPEQILEIHHRGALRILDKTTMETMVKDIAVLTQQLDMLTNLLGNLRVLFQGRDEIVTALVGTGVGLAIVDNEYHCWFANREYEALVEGKAVGGPCWSAFYDHPVGAGVCWGCSLPRLGEGAPLVESLLLARMRCGDVKWTSVRATPIKDDHSKVIAMREGDIVADGSLVNSLPYEERLLRIAQGLIHAGFGRARIYRLDEQENGRLVAAAARSDDPGKPESEYMQSLGKAPLPLSEDPYYREIKETGKGVLVETWRRGVSIFAKTLKLELPYLGVPVFGEDTGPLGFFVVDFVGCEFEPGKKPAKRSKENFARRKILEKHYATRDMLASLQQHYAPEIRNAFVAGDGDEQERTRRQILQEARLGVGAATTVADAMRALTRAYRELLPGCRIRVRRQKGETLEEVPELCVEESREAGPSGGRGTGDAHPRIDIADPVSLAAHVFRTKLGEFWIPDLDTHREEADARAMPRGYCAEGTQSMAQVLVQWERKPYGVLSIDSRKPIDWDTAKYHGPLQELAETTALVLRDIVNGERSERLAKVSEDFAAMTAFAMTASSDVIWRHWMLGQLAIITGCVANGLSQCELRLSDPETRDIFDELLRQIDNVVNLIRQGKPDDVQRVPTCDAAAFFKKNRDAYARKGIRVESALSSFQITVPEYYLRNLLAILTDNALAAVKYEADPLVTVRALDRGGYVRIEVEDNGSGIPPDKAANLMKKPVPSKQGSGLGLLIARGTALQYGGDLFVDSRGNPTKVVLQIPKQT